MNDHINRNTIRKRTKDNSAAIVLVLLFTGIYIVSLNAGNAYYDFGVTGIAYMNGEYYRFITCLFLHSSPRHLLGNCAALLCVSSLLTPFTGNKKPLFLFLSCGALSEVAYSLVISEQIYDIGASSGIFALIACLIVCTLRFPDHFHFKWYRPDVMIVAVYFVFANSSVTAFLVHTFGFAAGILISFVMVQTGQFKHT